MDRVGVRDIAIQFIIQLLPLFIIVTSKTKVFNSNHPIKSSDVVYLRFNCNL